MTESAGLDIAAMAREHYDPGGDRVHIERLAAAIADRLASIPERMSTDPDLSPEARRALIEAGAAIRAEV